MAQEYIDTSTGSLFYYSSSNSSGNQKLNYHSIRHLYYSNFNTGSGLLVEAGNYENYLESTLFSGSLRTLNSQNTGLVYSIPKSLFGTHIEPSTFTLISTYSGTYSIGSFTITDDGEGKLYHDTSHIGNIIYSHGQAIITEFSHYQHLSASHATEEYPDIDFKSNLPIYTHNYNIKISDFEFNHTLNPSAQKNNSIFYYSGSSGPSDSKFLRPSGQYADNTTGSAFQPYITTVGLYNDSNELIAVGKLAQPLPKPADTELTIQVKLDV